MSVSNAKVWTGQSYVASEVCRTCFQPECPDSVGGTRPVAATHSTRLQPGERSYRGYCEWAVHPDEASFILHRGFAVVDGQQKRAIFIHNEAYATQILVAGSDVDSVPFEEDARVAC